MVAEYERFAGSYLASKEIVLKEQGRVVHRACISLDPLPILCTSFAWGLSAGAATIPNQIALGRSKADDPHTDLHSTYTQWGSMYAWSGELLPRWKTGILVAILVGGRGIGAKRREISFLATRQVQRPKVEVSRWMKYYLSVYGQLDGWGDPFPLELGARFGFLEQLRVLAHLAACTGRVAPSRL